MTNHNTKGQCLKCRRRLEKELKQDTKIYECNDCNARIVGHKGIEEHQKKKFKDKVV